MEKTQETVTISLKMQEKYLHIIEKVNYYLFIFAICLLPFQTRFSLLAWEIWLVSWLLEGRFMRKENIQWHKGIMPIVLLTIWILWEGISYFWAINQSDAINTLVRHLSFIAILPIAIWGVNSQYNWETAVKWFIASCVLSVFIYINYIYIVQQWNYLQSHHKLPEYVSSWSYFGDVISMYKHRLYYGTILNLGIAALLQIRVSLFSKTSYPKVVTTLFFVSLFTLVAGIVLSGSRANMLTLIAISVLSIIQPLRGKTKVLGTALVVVAGIAIGGLLITQHPRFEKLQWDHIAERAAYETYEVEPRINIWYSALQTPTDYIIHGVGVGGNAEYLKPIYSEFKWKSFYDRQYNAHNQYLGVLINLGIFGAIFFLLIWLLYPYWYKGKTKQIATLVAVIIGLNMLTENMLERIDGVIITCCSILLIALLSRAQHAE